MRMREFEGVVVVVCLLPWGHWMDSFLSFSFPFLFTCYICFLFGLC